MSEAEPHTKAFDLQTVDEIIRSTVEPAAAEVDRTGAFPRAALEAFGREGLLGLISSRDVGGLGESHRAATMVVERVASAWAMPRRM